MGKPRPRPIVLDAGALIALEKRDKRMQALLQKAAELEARVIIPAGALAQVWSGEPSQAPIHRLLRRPQVEVPALDRVIAEGAGKLCRRSGVSDVVDASIVIAARQAGAVVVTSDPNDLTRLDPTLALEVL